MDLEFNLRFTWDLDSHSMRSIIAEFWSYGRIPYLDFDLSRNIDFGLLVASILFGDIHW